MRCPKCSGTKVTSTQMFTKTAVGPGYWYKHKHPWIAGFVAVVKVIGFINNTIREKWKCVTCQHEFSTGLELTEAEQQRLTQEQAEREYQRQAAERLQFQQEQARLAHERWVRDQERPAKARAFGVSMFAGFVILGAFLGFAGGLGWFCHESINSYYAEQMTKEKAKGTDKTNPVGLAFGQYLLGRSSDNGAQQAVQDASWPLLLIATIPLFGKGFDKKTMLYVLFLFLLRGIIHLLTWPATLVIDQITGPVWGAIAVGFSFGLWGIPAGLFATVFYNRCGD